MIAGLLIIIIAIMLLGAATARNWLTKIALAGLWTLAGLSVLIWMGTTFGPDGAVAAFVIACAVLMVTIAWARQGAVYHRKPRKR